MSVTVTWRRDNLSAVIVHVLSWEDKCDSVAAGVNVSP